MRQNVDVGKSLSQRDMWEMHVEDTYVDVGGLHRPKLGCYVRTYVLILRSTSSST